MGYKTIKAVTGKYLLPDATFSFYSEQTNSKDLYFKIFYVSEAGQANRII